MTRPKFAPPLLLASAVLLFGSLAFGQIPTGIITGTVTDPTGAVVPGATITITNKGTSVAHPTESNGSGLFSVPSLEPGEYEVKAEGKGFSTTVREAEVQAGNTITVNMQMTVGAASETVTVEAASAQINYESNTIQGVVARNTIQEIPLNGRGYLQLASLEPGVTMVAGATSQYNGVFQVSILGGISGRTLITLDGVNIDDSVQGGSSMNFSQETVEEFQLQSLNSDLSTGITGSGAINVVTRGGTNAFHGTAFFFYRDHNLAAYPGLARQPEFPNPFFARRNPGFNIGGPIKKDKLFFFFNYEYQNQVQAVTIQEDLPIFQGLNASYSSPYKLDMLSTRFDYHLNDRNNLFLRYSHDGNNTFGPPSGTPLPSEWLTNINYADQGVIGWTTSIRPTLVNDARFQYEFWSNKNELPTASNCPAPCLGLGLPSVLATIGSATFGAGNYLNAPQYRTVRRFELTDQLQWQKGSHRYRFGTDIERFSAPIDWEFCTPFCTVLLPLAPTPVNTTADLLNIPVYNLSAGIFSGLGIGSGHYPGPYDQSQENSNLRPRVYFQDTWKLRQNLTVNYGVAWEYETGLFNSDLTPPQFLAPIYGANNLHPTHPQKDEFQPVFGFAWSPGKGNKTVIRGGAGLYWETNYYFEKWRGSAEYGPVGDARITLEANALVNTFPGVFNLSTGQPVGIGAPLPIGQASTLTFGQMISLYNAQIANLNSKFAPPSVPTSGSFPVSGLDVAKTAIELFPPNYTLGRSYQSSIGVQRDLGHDMVLTADWARRQGDHFNLASDLDINHTNTYANGQLVGGIIPSCAPNSNYTPGVECVNGPINQWLPEGRSVYEGLLVKLTKRYSRNWQLTASYALQNLNTDYAPVNSNNYMQSYGPSLPRQNLNIAAIGNLPWGFQLTMNSSIVTRNPVEIVTTGVDLSGTGVVSGTNLPGIGFDCFCSQSQVAAAVAKFNSTYAGTKAPNGSVIPAFVLPPNYSFGDGTISQDFRLTKKFTFKERYTMSIFGEVFNAFNVANLKGYSFNLDTVNANPALQTYAFGQPTQRSGQTFGQGGPRAFQFGGRFIF